MKLLRIIRIWYCGKLPYAKRYKRWYSRKLFLEKIHGLTQYFLLKTQERVSPDEFSALINSAQVKYLESLFKDNDPSI